MNVSGSDEDFVNLTDGSTQFSDNSTDYYSPIPITAGTNPDTVGVSGSIKFHSPFVFSVSTGSQGTDEAPTPTAGGQITGLTASTTTLVVVPDTTSGTTVTTGGSGTPTGMTIEFRTDGRWFVNSSSYFKYGLWL